MATRTSHRRRAARRAAPKGKGFPAFLKKKKKGARMGARAGKSPAKLERSRGGSRTPKKLGKYGGGAKASPLGKFKKGSRSRSRKLVDRGRRAPARRGSRA